MKSVVKKRLWSHTEGAEEISVESVKSVVVKENLRKERMVRLISSDSLDRNIGVVFVTLCFASITHDVNAKFSREFQHNSRR